MSHGVAFQPFSSQNRLRYVFVIHYNSYAFVPKTISHLYFT